MARISPSATEEARVRNAQDSGLSEHSGLSERDVAVLAFERQWWRHVGAKEEAIRSELGLSSARYYQVLGALINNPGALVHDPMLVNRLQRMREARAESRARRSINADSSQPSDHPTED